MRSLKGSLSKNYFCRYPRCSIASSIIFLWAPPAQSSENRTWLMRKQATRSVILRSAKDRPFNSSPLNPNLLTLFFPLHNSNTTPKRNPSLNLLVIQWLKTCFIPVALGIQRTPQVGHGPRRAAKAEGVTKSPGGEVRTKTEATWFLDDMDEEDYM